MLPLIESWMSADEANFRQLFPSLIEQINKQHLISQTINEYRIFDTGNTSVAALLNPSTDKIVLKTALDAQNIINEVSVLKHWSQVVQTPDIYFIHPKETNFPIAFFISQYISDPMLDTISSQDRIDREISFHLGETLAKIHQLPSIPLDNPHINDLNKIIAETNKRLPKFTDPRIIQRIDKSLKIVSQSPFPLTICHMDFLPANLFYGEHLTVFDPTVAVTHSLNDLARTLLITEVSDPEFGQIESQEILKGYQSITPVDTNLIDAFKIINALRKIDRWTIKGNPKKVQRTIAKIQEIEI